MQLAYDRYFTTYRGVTLDSVGRGSDSPQINRQPEVTSADAPVNQNENTRPTGAEEPGATNGPDTQFVPTDSATGYRPTANDGPLLYPNGKPVYDSQGNIQDMF